jgi:hypothetical protein
MVTAKSPISGSAYRCFTRVKPPFSISFSSSFTQSIQFLPKAFHSGRQMLVLRIGNVHGGL